VDLPQQIVATSQVERKVMRRVARHEATRQSANFLMRGYLQIVFSLFGALLGLIAPKK
jgi:hypothetical protein